MDQEKDIEIPDAAFELADEEPVDETGSVDDFLRELEEKEKDLHITSETTFIEIAADLEEDDVPDFIREELSANGKKPEAPPATVAEPAPAKADIAKALLKKLEAELSAARRDNNTLRNESDALLKKISDLKAERAELYENAQRRLKDFESYKTRTERERGDTFQQQLSKLATHMLPALDNLDRALQFATSMTPEKQGEFKQFFDGIVLVNQQVNEVLTEMGIDAIPSVGEPFDPHLHEAVAMETTEEFDANTITAELLRGFRIGDKVVRHSMVKVAQAPPKPKAEEPAADPEAEVPPAEAVDGSEEQTQVFGEVDLHEIADSLTDDIFGFAETEEVVFELEETGFSIERNGEVDEPKKGNEKGTGEIGKK